MMSLMLLDVRVDVSDDRLGAVDQSLQCRPEAADRQRRLIEQRGELVPAAPARPLFVASRWLGLISRGTVPCVMVCPGEKYWLNSSDTRSTYCLPIADTECTLATASTGIW